MYAVDDGEVRVELGYLGKTISAAKAAEPDHSKTGGTAVGLHCNMMFHGDAGLVSPHVPSQLTLSQELSRYMFSWRVS